MAVSTYSTRPLATTTSRFTTTTATGNFTDVSFQLGIAEPSVPFLGWGYGVFSDYDNDGWLDLFTANGHVYPQVDKKQLGHQFQAACLADP